MALQRARVAADLVPGVSEFDGFELAPRDAVVTLTQLATIQEKLANAQALQKRLLDSSADLTTKLITVQTYTQVILSSQARISVLEGAQFSYIPALSLAQDVELGHIVTRAIPTPVNARSRSNSIVVGAIVGLILGIMAANLWAPIKRRLRHANT